ncbi:universal stress protein [Rhizobium sp. LEGMi198b]|uniref:universal stress protein n=1 Tax=unclassified Rhizobium TaxID=2613769 RepID=UPI0021A77F7C|nr:MULTISPECIES: universal stress protein [Rhizobium]MDK4741275.1 universal stress protein [Rhizobium sp. CNPSo 3464]UWU23637.1 universal stress protein [Rhizobium tropici]WFU04368.1 universal stress protein [Rhizobium sp. CB3171]
MYKTIVCAVGLGSRERAEHLVRTAQSLLETDGSLHVVHVVERFPSITSQEPDGWAVSVIDEAEKKLSQLCKQLSVPALIHVRPGRAGDTILAIAAEVKADLIVVAGHRPDVLDRVFGSTVDQIMHHAKCCVHVDRIEAKQ